MEYPRTLADTRAYLRSALATQGLTIRAAAKRVGVSGAALHRLMSEPNARPRIELAGRLQSVLGVPLTFWSLPEAVAVDPAPEEPTAAAKVA